MGSEKLSVLRTAFERFAAPISVLMIRTLYLTEARLIGGVVPSEILETNMSNSIKIPGRSLMVGRSSLFRAKAIYATTVIAVAAIGLSGTTFAQSSNTEMSVQIKTAHLDTSSKDGAEVLYRKIKRAAGKICGDSSSRLPLGLARKMRACKKEVVEKAVYKADMPMLIAVHTGEPAVNLSLFAKNEQTQKTRN